MSKRFGLIMGLVALMMGLMASTAFAKITLVEPGPYEAIDTIAEVQITEAPEEATHVTVAQCNVSGLPSTWGKRCNAASGQPVSPLTGNAFTFEGVVVERTFQDTDYTVQPPALKETSTQCKNLAEVGQQCAIIASYYKKVGFEYVPLTSKSEKVNILFQ